MSLQNIFAKRITTFVVMMVISSLPVEIVQATEIPGGAASANGSRRFDLKNPDATIGRQEPTRIRLPVRLAAYKTIVTKNQDGKTEPGYIQEAGIVRTIRARADRANHFYLGEKGEWHLETIPLRFARQEKRYTTRLSLSRVVSFDGSVEEHFGSIEVSGVLVPESAGVFKFVTNGRQIFRDKLGVPVVELAAGIAVDQVASTRKDLASGQVTR